VIINDALLGAASVHSRDMAAADLLAHWLPDSKTPQFEDRMSYVAYNYKWAAENIAAINGTTEDVFNAWMNSEYHRLNILTPDFAEFGAGGAVAANGTSYWALVIGVQYRQSAPLPGATCP
jgi:uncharacterized protein YkwD